MKRLGILILLFFAVIVGYGQEIAKDRLDIQQVLRVLKPGIQTESVLSDEQIKHLVEVDTTIKVKYIKKDLKHIQPAYYINGLFVNNLNLAAINPSTIEELSVEAGEFVKDNKKYSGKLYIKLKDWVDFKPITIKELKKKYINLPIHVSIIMIDNKILYDDYNELVINEFGIYKIEVQTLQNENEGLNLNVINLVTRSEKNIRESESIKIK